MKQYYIISKGFKEFGDIIAVEKEEASQIKKHLTNNDWIQLEKITLEKAKQEIRFIKSLYKNNPQKHQNYKKIYFYDSQHEWSDKNYIQCKYL